MHTSYEQQLSWSFIDPRPSTYYHKDSDTYLTFCNGIITTHSIALIITSSYFFNCYPTPQMKNTSFENVIQAIKLGAFGKTTWDINDFGYGSYHNYLHNIFYDHFDNNYATKIKETQPLVLTWFDKRNILGII